MALQLTNAMRVRIESATATLHPSIRRSFVTGIMRSLEHGEQPPSWNSVLHTLAIALSLVPASQKIISQSVGETNDSDDRRRRYF